MKVNDEDALSAKEFVDDCLCGQITLVSGSSVSEAFSLSRERELARSSSSAGEEVSRPRADLFMPAIPVSLSSVIFSSNRAMWGCATAMHIEVLGLQENQGLTSPSQTTDSESLKKLPAPVSDQIWQHKGHIASDVISKTNLLETGSAHILLSNFVNLGRSPPTKASLNIPDSHVSVIDTGCHLQGTTDPSFKTKELLKCNSLDTSATCNQYALYPTSKKQAAGKPGRFGFPSFPNIKLNRWGIPIGLGLYGGGESAANGWGTATSQPSNWGNNQSNQQGHWGGGGPNRSSGPQNNNSPQSANLKPNQSTSNNAPQQSTSSVTPPMNSAVNSNNQSVSSSGQQQSNQPITGQSNSGTNTWAQAAGKGLPSGNGSTDVQKLQSIKEALLSSEGWGGENVNQETHWDLPSSPEPGKDSAAPHWKIVVNNGCDLWENNLRNGGAVPPKPQQAPWGQNPITNYGGTWGEEDDASDTSNVWTGAPSNPNPQWGGNNTPNPPNMWGAPPKKTPEWGPNAGWGEHGPPRTSVEGASGEWGPHKPGPHIGSHPGPPPPGPHHGPHPGAPHPGQHPGAHPAGPHPVNHPGTHPGPHPGAHPGPHAGPHGPAPHGPTSHGPSQHGPTPHGPPQHGPNQHGPPTQHGPSQHGPSQHGPSPHGPTPHGPAPHGPGPLGPAPHGPVPHGPGPLGPGPHGPAPHNAPGGPGQWNNIGKDIKPTGWEEPSPPSVRRDDGTAVWGNPGQQSSVSRWKDMPNPNMIGRPNMPNSQQGRLPIQPIPGGPMKTDQRMWGQPGRNGSWGEPHDGSTVWGDESKPGSWGDAPITSPSWASKPKTPTGPSGAWPDQDIDLSGWNTQNKVNKDVTKDYFNTKQHLRTLLDIGYKKEDIEAVLRNNNLGLEETLMELGPRGGGGVGDAWRSPPSLDDHSSNPFPDLGNPNFQQQRFPPSHQQLPLNSQLQSGNGNQHVRALMHHIQLAAQAGYLNPQILNQPLAPNSLMLLNNMLSQISVLHKLMQQHQLYQSQAHLGKNSSHQLLSMSVHITKTKQQIQNLQNQIAAQQALYVKQQQQPVPQQPPSHLNPHITGGGNGVPPNAQNEFFKGLPDQLYANFSQMGVNEGPGMNSVVPQQQQQQPQHQQLQQQQQQQQQQQGSRLNQWKLPNLDSDEALNMINNDFVRAPGKPSMPQSQSSPNLNPLLPGSNSAWSLNNRPSESGWPDSSSSSGGGRGDGGSPPSSGVDKSSIVGLDSAWASPANNSGAGSYGLDIKPFEPGKQWMVKNIEDDPNITPGSVTRSPLSLGIKDSDLLTSITKTTTANTMSEIGSGGPLSALSLTSNTWSFNPGSGQPSSNSPLSSDGKLGGNSNSKSSTWSEGSQSAAGLTSELWGAPGNKTRGPPPGMSVNNSGKQSSTLGANGGSWGALGRSTSWTGDQQRTPSNSALHSAGNPSWPNSQAPSTWLILKNLTPQIDGSTLKTLCMQHGPLINFHLSLNHGFALVNYGSREEAAKAQGNLNNCLLSNTTILAEFANDSDVKQLLGQGPPPTPSAPSSSWSGSGRGSTPTSQSTSSNKVDSWGSGNSSSLWGNGPSSSASLWGGANLGEGDQHRATPSSLKSYLPDGLLTSESM